jgi:hypothetical protein
MDMFSFLTTLGAASNPVLPDPTAMRLALHGAWALVLGSGMLLLTGNFPRPYRWSLSGLVMAWTLLPGSASPAYWLGLAFQTPSLTSAGICLIWLVREMGISNTPRSLTGKPLRALKMLAAAGIVLGWVLLLDTLALLPVSVYAWGFSSAALGTVAVLAALLGAVLGLRGPVLILTVLALFVVTRLPTGNVWDALIDPWLWLAVQARWLVNGLRYWRAQRHSPSAIRV